MPTVRPRHTVTETDDVARVLDAAALTWPELHDDRAALLRRLVEIGGATVTEALDERIAARRQALRRAAGAFTGAYPAGAAAALKAEWPE